MPAQKAGPAPVRTIARTRFSRCRSLRASVSWASIARVSAFRRSGRLSTIVPTAPVTFTSMALLGMNIGRWSQRRVGRSSARRHQRFVDRIMRAISRNSTSRLRCRSSNPIAGSDRSDCRYRALCGRAGLMLRGNIGDAAECCATGNELVPTPPLRRVPRLSQLVWHQRLKPRATVCSLSIRHQGCIHRASSTPLRTDTARNCPCDALDPIA